MKVSLNATKQTECYLMPTFAVSYTRTPATWEGNTGWWETPLIGVRFYFLVFNISLCVIWMGKQVPEPKPFMERLFEMVAKKNDWWIPERHAGDIL